MDRSSSQAKAAAQRRALTSKTIGEAPRPEPEARPSPGARALTALASGALALPGLGGPAKADSPVGETTLRYAFSYYKEDNLSPGKFKDTGSGSRDRYEIYTHQFNLVTPLTSRIDASVDLLFETMAGASPWWVEPDPQAAISGQSFLQVMSGATIFEERFGGQVTVNHFFDRGKATLSGGVSSEKDYLSGNIGFAAERNYNDKNTTHSISMGYSWDTLTPTDGAAIHGRPFPEYLKNSFTLDTVLSQILTRNSILQVAVAYKRSTGFLSDPYKRFLVAATGTTVPDSRPEKRNQLTVSGRYRHHIDAANASVHADAAFHWDDWGVIGMSAELAWYQTVLEVVQIIPSFRYYSQSQAFFYGPVFQFSSPVFGTSDYRLSPYGAIRYGLRAEGNVTGWPERGMNWLFSIGYDRYISRGSYALQSVRNESPGLVKYHLFSMQLGARF